MLRGGCDYLLATVGMAAFTAPGTSTKTRSSSKTKSVELKDALLTEARTGSSLRPEKAEKAKRLKKQKTKKKRKRQRD